MRDQQGAIFFEGEGDNWYARNASVIGTAEYAARDVPLRLLAQSPSYRPRRVLEIGCATGWRLAALRARYGCTVVGIEPSATAIDEGKRRYGADLDLRRGLSRELPVAENETFDLVIAAFVFHWVSRDALLRSIAEVDRTLVDRGLLLLYDFFPDAPTRRRYHHVADGTYTYKQEVADGFLGTKLYRHVARVTTSHSADNHELFALAPIPSGERAVCDILEKDVSAYVDGG